MIIRLFVALSAVILTDPEMNGAPACPAAMLFFFGSSSCNCCKYLSRLPWYILLFLDFTEHSLCLHLPKCAKSMPKNHKSSLGPHCSGSYKLRRNGWFPYRFYTHWVKSFFAWRPKNNLYPDKFDHFFFHDVSMWRLSIHDTLETISICSGNYCLAGDNVINTKATLDKLLRKC